LTESRWISRIYPPGSTRSEASLMASSKRPGLHSTLLRVPDQVWEQLVSRAKAERRSATQHIVWLIEQDLAAHSVSEQRGGAREGAVPSGQKPAPKKHQAADLPPAQEKPVRRKPPRPRGG
jgi:hypothetical protein